MNYFQQNFEPQLNFDSIYIRRNSINIKFSNINFFFLKIDISAKQKS